MSTARRLAVVAPVLLLIGPGCGSGGDATPEAVREARARWDGAGVRSYNMEWIATGEEPGHYFVFVRDGRIVEVRRIAPDGREEVVGPEEAARYDVVGMFRAIEQDLAALGARGTDVHLEFDPDPALGYPRRYRREVAGTSRRLALEVVYIDVSPPATIPARYEPPVL